MFRIIRAATAARPERPVFYSHEGQAFYQGSRGVALNHEYRPGDGGISVIYDPNVLTRLENDAFRDTNLGRIAVLFSTEPPADLQELPQEGGSWHS
jgi:hypothetical protein